MTSYRPQYCSAYTSYVSFLIVMVFLFIIVVQDIFDCVLFLDTPPHENSLACVVEVIATIKEILFVYAEFAIFVPLK